MMRHDDNVNECERYRELAAIATAAALTDGEMADIEQHLRKCQRCRVTCQQYRILAQEGFAALAGLYEHRELNGSWDDTTVRRKLLARVSELEEWAATTVGAHPQLSKQAPWPRRGAHRTAIAALAACLLLGIGIPAWRLHTSGETRAKLAEASARGRLEEALMAKKSVDVRLAAQSSRIGQLQAEDSVQRQEAARLRAQLEALRQQWDEERKSAQSVVNTLTANKAAAEEQVRVISSQRDRLSAQLREIMQTSQNVQTELASLRADRYKWRLQEAELEARLTKLTAANQDQERRLANSEQYLLSDRDIRELMGARNLYIADVFDVDSSSRTRKPFGRVFYTQGKSLIFYAFDLDRQPRVKNTSAFQVWGQKETPQDQHSRVRNLGVLYLDSESNRRWILRFDDPRTLAEIDAVFVTVEPHGGSVKPTGKPFLFAMLLKKANHP
jgi:hypothetical protein